MLSCSVMSDSLFHGLCSGLRPHRATRAGPGYVPGLSLCTQAQGSADHSGHSRVASRPGQWGRARGHQGCSRCPSPCCCLSVTPPALDVGAQRYLHAPKGTGTKVVGHRDTYSPPSPGCRMRPSAFPAAVGTPEITTVIRILEPSSSHRNAPHH